MHHLRALLDSFTVRCTIIIVAVGAAPMVILWGVSRSLTN